MRRSLFFAVLLAACRGSSLPQVQPDLGPLDYGRAQLTLFSRATAEEAWAPLEGASFWGDQIDVRMSGLPAGAAVVIAARSASYHSSATFHADGDGNLALSTAAPDAGDYPGVDPEVNSYGGRLYSRIDAYSLPMIRRLSAGFNIQY